MDAEGGEHAKQRVVAGVLVADDADFAAAQVGEALDAGFLAGGDLIERFATEQGDAADGEAVGTDDHRGFANSAAEIDVADGDLLGSIGAASAGLEGDGEALGGVVAAGLGEAGGTKAGKKDGAGNR